MTDGSRRLWLTAALIGVAAVWGATFVMVKAAVAAYPMYAFLTLRYVIAVLALAVAFPTVFRRLNAGVFKVGLVAGAFLTAGYVFQTWGLQATSASKAAFITGMFVVITPALQAVVLKRRPRASTVLGVALAVAGLWLLSGADAGGWNVGDTRVLLCAIAYSAHMIVLGGVGRDHDPVALTLVQLGTVGAASGILSVVTREPVGLPQQTHVWVTLLVTGVLATTVAFVVQTTAQRYISPARTALILIMEPAFGGVFGWLAGEVLGVSGLLGSAMILAGMVVAEFGGLRKLTRERVVLEQSLEGPTVPMVEPETGEGEREVTDSQVDSR